MTVTYTVEVDEVESDADFSIITERIKTALQAAFPFNTVSVALD